VQTIRDIQAAAWENKLAKGFNISDVPLEFGLLNAEIGEAFTAWRKDLPDYGEELADIFLYLVAVAEMTGIDLADAVTHKMAINAARTYRTNRNGVPIRDEAP
jgi:NTP pyrophosphatase (non-canonical NTP hydrolase)